MEFSDAFFVRKWMKRCRGERCFQPFPKEKKQADVGLLFIL
jgi:hypothetical protein